MVWISLSADWDIHSVKGAKLETLIKGMLRPGSFGFDSAFYRF